MSVLLYFVSYASLFALLLSIIAVALWLLVNFVRALGRFIQALINPPPQQPRLDLNPHAFKRAGQ